MNKGKYVFAQLMEFAPSYEFQKCVERYNGHQKVRTFFCWDQFLALSFGQITYRESIRSIIICLSAQESKQYHLGFRSTVTKSTLLRANEKRDWRIYRDFALILIQEARQLHIDEALEGIDPKTNVYALDSSTIDLCLSVFPWAKFRKTKSAIKLHTLITLRGNIPTFIHISDGKMHDVNVLDVLEIEGGSFYLIDRGYIDYSRLYEIHQAGAFFVTQMKSNMSWKRIYSNPLTKEQKESGIRCDQIIRFDGYYSKKKYPEKLRRVKYYAADQDQYYIFLTNNFILPPETIAYLYKQRWQVELFFKWIKQHLRVKVFWGHSENAVKTQIWVAICVYVLSAIIRKKLNLSKSLYEILQILSVSCFDKTSLSSLFSDLDNEKTLLPSQQATLLLDF